MTSKKVFCVGSCEKVTGALSPAGYEVACADEKDITSLVKGEKTPAVVVDLVDTIKGIEILREIKNANAGVWIVALADNKDIGFIIDTLKAGANDYLIKPINEKELQRSVKERKFHSVAEIGIRSQDNISVEEEYRKISPSRFYSSSFVDEYGKIETLRAERYNRVFSIILSQIEWPDDTADNKVKDKEKKAILKKVIEVITDAARDCDVVGMAVNDQFLTILPETDYMGSLITIRKMRRAIDIITKDYPQISVQFSQSTYPKDGKRYSELLCAAEKRIAEQKDGLWAKFGLKDKLFWEAVSTLLEKKHDDPCAASTFDVGNDAEFPHFFLNRFQEIALQDAGHNPKRKGILYLGLRKISPDAPILKSIHDMPQTMTKVFIVGEGWGGADIANATSIYISDERLLDTLFILFMREDTAYAAMCREGWGDTFSCFHTADPYLVESLIEKFQKDYSLQEQL